MGKKAIISVISNANIEEDDMIEVVSPGSFEKIEDGGYTIRVQKEWKWKRKS